MAEQAIKATPELQSNAELSRWKRTGTKVHWQLVDGSSIIGTVNWFDKYTVQVQSEELGTVTIPKHALLWYREATKT